MKITICGSLSFFKEMGELAKQLKDLRHEVFLPDTAIQILAGDLGIEKINLEKTTKSASDRIIKNNAIINHYHKIKSSDAILVVNKDKNGIVGYIGGSTFLEIGFAFVLNKKIFLLNNIPDIAYKDELVAMKPIVLNNGLNKIN